MNLESIYELFSFYLLPLGFSQRLNFNKKWTLANPREAPVIKIVFDMFVSFKC
jgi:hypothetical protein